MTDTAKSKFVAFFDAAATPVNRRPNLTGEYRLAGSSTTNRVALWGGVSAKTGKLYARGRASPEGVSAALTAMATATESHAPANIDLTVGEMVLFENPKATVANKQPKFFGYAREAHQYVRLAGWEHGNGIIGTAEPFRPADRTEFEAPAPEVV